MTEKQVGMSGDRKDKAKQGKDEYQNRMEGKKVVFVESSSDPENADGIRGHLEVAGNSDDKSGIYEKWIKRIMDMILSGMGLIMLSPVYLAVFLAVKADDPGPVFFTQKRVGKNKRYFKLHKFRSMRMSTPHDIPTHMLENPDQYITRVGKFLRKYSLDELPQVWDIFVGNMSVIGPRPALWNQDVLVAERDKYGANDVKPGLTGWAQINGRDELEIGDKARLDGEYVEKLKQGGWKALFFDVRCFFGTVLSVLGSDGVVEGGTGELKKRGEEIASHAGKPDFENTATFQSNQKKILIFVNHDIAIYNFRLELVKRMLADGYEVHISSPTGEHTQELMELGAFFHEIVIDRHGMNPRADMKILSEYKRLIKKIRPMVILTYTVKPNVYGGIAAKLTHTPFIANITGLGTTMNRGGLKGMLVLFLYKLGLKGAQKVFFQNESNREFMLGRHVISKSCPCEVIPGSGVNLDTHCLEPYPEETDRLVFTTIGRIMRDKGTDELLCAAEKIKEKYPAVLFRMIGFFDDDYEERIRIAEEKGIVEYIEQQKDIHLWMKETHAVIHPSYHEGMSNVLLEAAATGRPILASDIPGCRETFEEGVSGLGFQAQDDDGLAAAIEKFIQLPHQQRAEMGRAGRVKMEREFDRNLVVDAYMREIRGLEN